MCKNKNRSKTLSQTAGEKSKLKVYKWVTAKGEGTLPHWNASSLLQHPFSSWNESILRYCPRNEGEGTHWQGGIPWKGQVSKIPALPRKGWQLGATGSQEPWQVPGVMRMAAEPNGWHSVTKPEPQAAWPAPGSTAILNLLQPPSTTLTTSQSFSPVVILDTPTWKYKAWPLTLVTEACWPMSAMLLSCCLLQGQSSR